MLAYIFPFDDHPDVIIAAPRLEDLGDLFHTLADWTKFDEDGFPIMDT